jgi:hypothetical protein
MPQYSVRFLRRCLWATWMMSANFGLIAASVIAPLDEPYWSWHTYGKEWLSLFIQTTAAACAVFCVVLLIAAGSPFKRIQAIVVRFPGFGLLWAALPLTALWSAARYLAAPHTDGNFNFGDASYYLGWPTDVAAIASGFSGSIATGIVIPIIGYIGWKRESKRIDVLCHNQCPTCSYSLEGTTDHCPECGWQRVKKMRAP